MILNFSYSDRITGHDPVGALPALLLEIEVKLPEDPQGRSVKVAAKLDTRSDESRIPHKCVEELGLSKNNIYQTDANALKKRAKERRRDKKDEYRKRRPITIEFRVADPNDSFERGTAKIHRKSNESYFFVGRDALRYYCLVADGINNEFKLSK